MGASGQLVPRGMFQAHSHTHGQHHCRCCVVGGEITVHFAMPMTDNIVRWQLVFYFE